jgi:hypothetical protein
MILTGVVIDEGAGWLKRAVFAPSVTGEAFIRITPKPGKR